LVLCFEPRVVNYKSYVLELESIWRHEKTAWLVHTADGFILAYCLALLCSYLCYHSIGAEGATAIATALQGNTALTTLDLSGHSIGDEGALAIAAALKINSALTTLSLGYNGIGEIGALAIAAALEVNTAITTLDLGWWRSTGATVSIEASLTENREKKAAAEHFAAKKARKKAAAKATKAATAQAAADRAASEAAHQSLLQAPCGSHTGCEQLVGAFIIEQLANLDTATLLKLGVTSVVDLLVCTYDPEAAAHAASQEEGVSASITYAYTATQSHVATAQLIKGLFEPLKTIPRRKLLKLLGEKALAVLPTVFDADVTAATLATTSVKDWAAQMHVTAAAVAELHTLGIDADAADLELLEHAEIKKITLKLMETSYMNAWWFEHAVVHTATALQTPTTQHGNDEL
jgi:hypothetical protein